MKSIFKILLLLFGLSLALPTSASAQGPPVLAFYYAWFDQNTWTAGQSVDLPAVRYASADPTTIERHAAQAKGAGIDALVQSWYGPQVENNQTETNFRILLDKAQAVGLQAAVSFETRGPFFGDIGSVTSGLAALMASHVQHPAYFRYQGKPVIFFWRQQRFSVEQWAAIRDQIDPGRSTYWIAEGVDISYQAVFDGHHLYSIAWASSPAGQLAKWGNRVRAFEAENQADRLWIATAMPGYDDTRLPRADAFSVPRRGGDYYRETWQGALASGPDMVIITSFNEWPEGTHIEPSDSYGNLYLDLTRELVTGLRGSPPAAPLPAVAAQESPAPEKAAAEAQAQAQPPDGPYIEITGLTNVRSGPSTELEIVGRLPAGSQIAVVGRLESSEWWQIEIESGIEGKGWVAAEVVDFVGEATNVPVVEPPPAPDPAPAPDPEAEPEVDDAADAPETDTEAADSDPSVTIPEGGVNVRSGPGLDFELLGRLNEGSRYPVTAQDKSGEWWQIEYAPSETGLAWVADAVIDFSGEPESVSVAGGAADSETAPAEAASAPEPGEPEEPVIAGTVEALDAINIRSEPSLEGDVLGGLFLGETANALALSEDGEWWQIELPEDPDQTGWVAAEFVEFSGEQELVPVFGVGTATPAPNPTNPPGPTPTATPRLIPAEQPTFAPTATSIYEATSAAMLAARPTPDPAAATAAAQESSSGFGWQDIPWGMLSLVVILGFLWYQFSARRRRGSDL